MSFTQSVSTHSARQDFLEAPLDRAHAESLQRQLYQRLKEGILKGQLAAGSRLPGSRALAETLSVSRNTVTIAYEHLISEGYVRADRKGSTVAALMRPVQREAQAENNAPSRVALRLSRIRSSPARSDTSTALRPGVPSLSHFPLAVWRRMLDRAVREASPAELNYGDPFGQAELRAAIAAHVARTRGVHCEPSQVIVTEGAQEALMLCVRLLTNPGDTAWVEDPGYRGAKAAMHAGDLRIVPKRMDEEGLHVGAADWRSRTPRLIYTTPSHQYPTGAVMSVARRLALISDARKHGTWIIEDDYDSEFRHSGEPIGAMQGLVADAPVLYVGTFSKTMFASLRLGFLVMPPRLLVSAQDALREMLRGGHSHEQLAMAGFIESGQFARHLGRMRRLYRERQHALRGALTRHLRVPHIIEGGQGGLHLAVRLPRDFPDARIAEAARQYGMAPMPLSSFAMAPALEDNGLVLGYGNTATELLDPLVKRLSQLVLTAGG
ncbi:PLP-dependent aminotransferase family protein [Polaromonas aquatica]|uniref:MocR-like pyridoxine biosynthesis transcription factor PdxR n=1 Tax=Polaromonas aquatica TaxID=332657 RepID=UPI003D660D06